MPGLSALCFFRLFNVCLCVHTCHVCNSYITYIVASMYTLLIDECSLYNYATTLYLMWVEGKLTCTMQHTTL